MFSNRIPPSATVARWLGRRVIVTASLVALLCACSPRPRVPKAAPVPSEASLATPASLPFVPGEKLSYDISASKLFLSGDVGRLDLTVQRISSNARTDNPPRIALQPGAGSGAAIDPALFTDSDPPGDPPNALRFKAQVVSKGFFTRLLGVKVDDKYESLVRSDDFSLLGSVREIDQGNIHRRQQTEVQPANGLIKYIETDLSGAPNPPKIKTNSYKGPVLDLLSAIYFIRTLGLKPGHVVTIPVTDGGEVHKVEVAALAAGEVQVDAGKFKSVEIEMKIFGGLIKHPGQLLIWLSDDSKRLPVRARVKLPAATVTLSLTNIGQQG